MDDPQADFLAREHAILGDDAAMFGNSFASSTAETPAMNNDVFLNEFASPTVFQPVSTLTTASLTSNHSFDNSFTASGVYAQDLLSSVNSSVPEIESEAVRKWKVDFAARVSEKESRAREKHQRVVNEAREALDKFYAEYNERKQKTILKNKNAGDPIEDVKVCLNIWEQVFSYVDIANSSSNKDGKLKGKLAHKEKKGDAKKESGDVKVIRDMSRMKQLLISLKNDPNSPGNGTFHT